MSMEDAVCPCCKAYADTQVQVPQYDADTKAGHFWCKFCKGLIEVWRTGPCQDAHNSVWCDGMWFELDMHPRRIPADVAAAYRLGGYAAALEVWRSRQDSNLLQPT